MTDFQKPPINTQPGQNVTVITAPNLGTQPVSILCPKCNAQISTVVTFEKGACTWLACVGICCLVGWLGCCLIPFCVDGCKDVVHTCPNCQQYIGTHKRL